MIPTRTIYGKRLMEGCFHGVRKPFLTFPGTAYRDGTPYANESFSIDTQDMFRHILLLGGSGSGKSNTIHQMVAGVMSHAGKDSINIIFDTKADYYHHRSFRRPGDYVLGNSQEFRDVSGIWNLFDELTIDGEDSVDVEANAREIASVLFKGRGSETQPFFANAARDLFASTLVYFVRRFKERPSAWADMLNNEDLFRFIMLADATHYTKYLKRYSDLRGVLTYFGDGSSAQALGVFAELHSMAYDCFQGVFRMKPTRARRSFSVRRSVREKGGRNLFIEYDMALGETLTPVYSLLVDLALKEALSSKAEGRTYLFLDELKLLPRVSHLEDALNFGRGKHISVTAGLQSVDQMTDCYGKEKGQVMLGGFGNVIAMKTSDPASREYISRLFGPNLIAYRYDTVSNQPIDREREGNTVEQWDQQQMIVGQAVVGLCSQNEPFLFQFDIDPTA